MVRIVYVLEFFLSLRNYSLQNCDFSTCCWLKTHNPSCIRVKDSWLNFIIQPYIGCHNLLIFVSPGHFHSPYIDLNVLRFKLYSHIFGV